MALKSSKNFFNIGPFAKHLDEIESFGSSMYLSYAILELLQKQKNIEKMYLNALALDDEESMILYKEELDLLRRSFDSTLITTFSSMPEIS
tara:strand:- start:429 stop:701 length:273 start_codon:yes stop_codon:yes gene_type:complete